MFIIGMHLIAENRLMIFWFGGIIISVIFTENLFLLAHL